MLLAQISKVKVPENLDVNLTRIFPSQVLHWNLNIDFVLFSFNKVYLPSLDESYIYIYNNKMIDFMSKFKGHKPQLVIFVWAKLSKK